MSTPLEIARQVITDEADALGQLAATLNHDFDAILDTMLSAHQIIVSGLGKSGDIARKMAASLTSTGTPALCMHPVEALHGDLGIVNEQHCLIALSRSGNTDEVLRFVTHFHRLGGPVIGITQGRQSKLAELARHTILLPDVAEAGPLNLAPTTSCVMMLAVGDALAMALLHRRGLKQEDFAQYHPEGALGRRLLLRAGDLMHSGDDLPLARAEDSFGQLILEMTRKQLGLALIVEQSGQLLGTFTDGDLRRVFERIEDPRKLDARAAYTGSRRSSTSPPVPVSTVAATHAAVDCLRIMSEGQITSLIVTDDTGRPQGVLRLMDLLRAGLG
ncbi:MAG: KpsF/GutQ family sugar-phosphate isomerase [Planctomycetota bacterium]